MEKFEQPKQNEAIVSSIKEKLLKVCQADTDLTYQDVIANFAGHLEKNYPDHQQYLMYHILLGSSPRETPPNFDFPGEDSVELFIDNLFEKAVKKER